MNIPKELIEQWVQDSGNTPSVKSQVQYIAQRAAEWALEEAAKVCENMERNGAWITKLEAAKALRALKELK